MVEFNGVLVEVKNGYMEEKEIQAYINYLKNKFPDYKENKFLKFGKAKKQSLKIRLAVETMMFFNKIGIDKFVYRIISLL